MTTWASAALKRAEFWQFDRMFCHRVFIVDNPAPNGSFAASVWTWGRVTLYLPHGGNTTSMSCNPSGWSGVLAPNRSSTRCFNLLERIPCAAAAAGLVFGMMHMNEFREKNWCGGGLYIKTCTISIRRAILKPATSPKSKFWNFRSLLPHSNCTVRGLATRACPRFRATFPGSWRKVDHHGCIW
jgi:hypothetical protein